jgi:Carboxypeptidase regulatory-like domain/TonB dependent receptor
MRIRSLTALSATVLLVQGLSPILVRAQVDRTAITGTVTDQQGNRVPESRVRAIDSATGFRRETTTTSQGTYELPGLPPGVYSVQFFKAGFADSTVDRVEQTIGQTRTLNAQLEVARGQQQTTVTESLVALDQVDATIGTAIERAQLNDLPINGRNWATLTALAPGAIDNGAGDQRTIRFAGHGLDDNNLTLDGVDATAVYNQMQREYMRLNIPLDSIDQFQVQSQNFGADSQTGTSGGQISVGSPSGTNYFHGDAFDYFRNSALNARSPFDGASPRPFLLNQFGGGVGGPIIHGKTFFHLNYEGLRQRLDGTQIGLVPSPSFLAQAALTSPALIHLLQAYPAGTSPTSNPSVWNYVALGRQVNNEDSGMIRLDHYFSDRTTAFVRFNSDEAVQTIPSGQLIVKALTDTKFNNGAVALSHVFAPSLINETKFGINQTIYHTANVSPVPLGLAVSGFSSVTGASTTDYPSKSFDLIDDLSWAKGRHVVKFGFETRWILLNQGTSQSGTLTYTSTANFLANSMGSATYTAILSLVRQRKTQYFAYIQDEWKATDNLTITAGIRYNFFNALHALDNNAVPFDFDTCGGFCPRTYSFFHPRYNDFDPRIGIAWAHGDTVLRVGGGIYHTDGQIDDQNLPISNTVDRYSFTNTTFPGLSYPLTPFLEYAEAGGLGVVSPRALDRNRKDNYVAAWTVSVQRKLPLNILGTAAYLGNKGTYVLTTTYTNLADPITGVVPYPAFGAVSWRGDVGNSTFHALQLNARRAFQNGFLFTANYMWSHSINDGSIGGGESDTPQNSFCRSCDKASSDNDVRQLFNLSAVYQLPFGAGKPYLSSPGVTRALAGGWTLSAIGSVQTGLPVNITIDRSNGAVPGDFAISGSERPNYVYGVPLTPPGGSTPGEWINPAAFSLPAAGTFGDLGRNAFRARGISQVDLSLAKDIPVSERVRVRFRADVFNVLNRAQYGAPNADLGSNPQTPTANFGVITTTITNYATGRGTQREFQLSAKILF